MKTIILLIILLLPVNIFTQDLNELDKLLNDAYKMDIFSGVVLIADKENVQYMKAFGYSDYDLQTSNLTDTKFNIGSIGKFFTQILIAQLLQEGKLELSDNLEKVYPVYKNENDKKITVKLLLSFSAGLGDYFRIAEFNQHPKKYTKIADLISVISTEPLLYEPGTSREYSNSSYVFLGGIIENITGKSYLENLKERILIPLGMNGSDFIYKGTKSSNTAKGFMVNVSGNKLSTYDGSPGIPTPAGGMFSTAEDLLKLDRSLMNDNVLLEDEYKVLLFNRFNTDVKTTFKELLASPDFGLGVAGGSPGWNAVYDQNVGGKYTVILLSNFDQGAERILNNVHDILLGKETVPLTPPPNKYIYNVIKEKGASYFVENYKEVLKGLRFEDDGMLNMMGYDFLFDGNIEAAISVFTVNTKLYPDIANTYDSLAEAYLKSGNKKLALENYKKAFEMDPGNKNAENIIEELSKE